MNNIDSQNQPNTNDEIDVRELIIPIWKAKKIILLCALGFAFLGGVLGILSPPKYKATSVFLPQNSENGSGNNLSGLAALAGINLNASSSGGEISPVLYGKIIVSEPFKSKVLDSKIRLDNDSMSYRSYLIEMSKSLFSNLKNYTTSIQGKVFQESNIPPPSDNKKQIDELFPLSDEEYSLHRKLNDKINIGIDKKEGVVSLSVIDSSPSVAAQVAQTTEKLLQDWIIEHKVKNARIQYEFIDKQYKLKQLELYEIQDKISSYMDRNQNVISAKFETRINRLEAEYNMINSVYIELAKQKEQAAIQLSRDTPTFSVLDPVNIPKEKTGPKISLYILGSFFMGIILSVSWVLLRNPVYDFFKDLNKVNILN